ncbi:hypothetical protein ABW21_db0200334 [Orbilia brochopaga]|nr:hypothetical protein ABW21_db0200334 [Drechslerella brochopaga]
MEERQLQLQKLEFIRVFFESLADTIKQNPQVLTALIPVVAAGSFNPLAILSALGFAATGPVADSFAATWQSSIGSVPAGHLFALIQSIGMSTSAIVIGARVGLAAAVFILITYLVEHFELNGKIEQEVRKFGKLVVEYAVSLGVGVSDFMNSPGVQARMGEVRRAGDAAFQNAMGLLGGLLQRDKKIKAKL